MYTKKIPKNIRSLLISKLLKKYPTPFYVYDEAGMLGALKKLTTAFSWNTGFRNYFAVKATPNPHIMQSLFKAGCGMDASSLAELLLCERIGATGENILFSSNNTSAEEFQKAMELGAIINLDDLSHLPYLEKHAGLPGLISFRYNPGDLISGNTIIGTPEQAKFGATRQQLFEGYRLAKEKGVTRFGLHTMVASNELNLQHFIDVARMIFELAHEIETVLDIRFEFIDLGGGLGIPYFSNETPLDIVSLSEHIQKLYGEILGESKPKLYMECGRYITGPHGYLVSKVRHIKDTYKTFIGLDASMNNLMRPGMYGAHHHITILEKETHPVTRTYDVTGSLCENNDKFAIDRKLPEVATEDVFIIHDAGAHGHAMGFNYNGKLRSPEVFVREDGSEQLIRRAETMDDLFATLNV